MHRFSPLSSLIQLILDHLGSGDSSLKVKVPSSSCLALGYEIKFLWLPQNFQLNTEKFLSLFGNKHIFQGTYTTTQYTDNKQLTPTY